MDHSQHAAMAAAAGSQAYKRSIQSYAAIPDVVLIDADAKPVRLRELLASGDPVMVNFIFTTCTTICPVMTQVFADVRDPPRRAKRRTCAWSRFRSTPKTTRRRS